jgi:transcription-repair coupling factor (superfamily II helicase)
MPSCISKKINYVSSLLEITKRFTNGSDFQRLLSLIENPPLPPVCGQAPGASKALLAVELSAHLNRNILIITPEQSDAYLMLDDVNFFRRMHDPAPDVFVFPHLELLPYESQTPELTIRMERLAPLQHVLESRHQNDSKPAIVITPVSAAMKKMPALSFYEQQALRCDKGKKLKRDTVSEWLVSQGYEFRDLVAQRGDFSIRGDIIDIYSFSYSHPARLEFWGDEIDSIRLFEVATQRSIAPITSAVFYPGNEEALIAKALEQNQALQPLWSFFGDDVLVVLAEPDQIESECETFFGLVEKRYELVVTGDVKDHELHLSDEDFHEHQTVIIEPPETLYATPDEIQSIADQFPSVQLTEFSLDPDAHHVNIGGNPAEIFGEDKAQRIKSLISVSASGQEVIIVCDNEGQKNRMDEIIQEQEHPAPESGRIPILMIGEMHRGFTLAFPNVMLCTDREIFGRYKRYRSLGRDGIALPLEDLMDLQPGDFIVHIDHGIGQFVGIRRLETEGKEGEYLELRYADNGKLYVPMEQIDRVGRYLGGENTEPTLSKLGTKNWDRAKNRAKQAIEDMAEELLDLYATRSVQKGHAFNKDTHWQHEFEASFLYEETPDQWRAIEDVKKDMESEEPMDRLVCGDVGFGKTEVAIRAAFKAVMDGKQVAILAPTTILCEQHFNTFKERLADYPVKIEMLSRFVTSGDQKKTVERINQGDVDIVCGTHRLISKDIKFDDLGILIIDEEQRFGVKHKERLRQMRKTVDTLILSATPIPRTLYMAVSGIRNMSLVSTPPKNRHPIETYIMEWSHEVIESAILRELSRDGQVYIVHNKVQSIMQIAKMIQDMIPQARVCVGHGQMGEKELENVMKKFIHHEYDILVATTIIENGLDIPNVNTIIINKANEFGLSQLYQLRGRVGRDRHRAYCYLMVPSKNALTSIARRRLLALQQHNQLGAGFQLAMQDMEIRGIGNILGREQHGYMVSVGFDLYTKLLSGTISSIRNKKGLAPEWETTLEMSPKGTIPPTYVESSTQRMSMHQRIAKIKTYEEIDKMRDELTDIYGKPPKLVEQLLLGLQIRVRAHQSGLDTVNVGKNRGFFSYHPSQIDHFNPLRVIQLNGWDSIKLNVETKGDNVIVKFEDAEKRGDMIQRVTALLDAIDLSPEDIQAVKIDPQKTTAKPVQQVVEKKKKPRKIKTKKALRNFQV